MLGVLIMWQDTNEVANRLLASLKILGHSVKIPFQLIYGKQIIPSIPTSAV